MKVDVLLGLQWGDEGKGKIVDVLTPQYDIIARFQGGPNAGHTLEFDGIKHVLHIIPSGIFHSEKINIIGNGVLIEPVIFEKEITGLQRLGVSPTQNLKISNKSHLILPTHRLLDAAYEAAKGKAKVGSTLKGIGPTYTDKTARLGLRVGDTLTDSFEAKYHNLKTSHIRILDTYGFDWQEYLIDNMPFAEYEKKWLEAIRLLPSFDIIDSEYYLNDALKSGKKILAEGAQGSLLDIDFGSYPFVTSSNTVCAGVCSGLGIAPSKIGKVYGIFKAYCTRVGSGPFPTELIDADGEKLRTEGREFGSTTGRPRRCGWLDLPILKYSIMLNGVTDLIMMKADVLNSFETINICTEYAIEETVTEKIPYDLDAVEIQPLYEKIKGWNGNLNGITSYNNLPEAMKKYISTIEQMVEIPITMVSIGPDRTETIVK